MTVDVRNAAGTPGLAAAAMASLLQAGFTAGGTATASVATSSAVHYRPGAQAAAGAAARTLGAGVLVTADAAVPARHVRVVLGTTYAPPLPGPAPAAAAGPTGPPVTAGGVPCVD